MLYDLYMSKFIYMDLDFCKLAPLSSSSANSSDLLPSKLAPLSSKLIPQRSSSGNYSCFVTKRVASVMMDENEEEEQEGGGCVRASNGDDG